MKPRIFISYKRRDPDYPSGIVEAVHAHLELTCEVKRDNQLRIGDQWRQKLSEARKTRVRWQSSKG